MKKIYIALILFGLFPVFMVQSVDFYTPVKNEYYPGTEFTITLLNCQIGTDYSLLIGANQNEWDYQWDNFTAVSLTMERTIIHFTEQTRLDNNSNTISRLLIELYKNDVRQDVLWLEVNHYNKDINLLGYANVIRGGIATLAALFLAYILVKYILRPILGK